MKTVNVGLIGLGTVGGGVAKTLLSKGELLKDKTGAEIKLLKVFDKDKKKFKEIGIPARLAAKSVEEVTDDVEIDILVELIGGIHPATEIIMGALCNGKHIVTANKALIAGYGKEIFDIAEQLGCIVGFEASVCGAMPIIKILKESFAANSISALYGIVNGTSNYVITRMIDENCSLEAAIKEAQAKGLAEKNASLDIDGHDACHKLCILAMLAFGRFVKPEDVYVEGIRDLELQDILYAKSWDYDIKLLAIAKRKGNSIELRVHPTLIPAKHLLSAVKYEDNAVFIKGDMIGESMLYGKGAGRYPAASSVMSDIMDISRVISASHLNTSGYSNFIKASSALKIADMGDLVSRYYVKISAIDKPGVLASVSSILAKNKISIATVSQKERKEGEVVPIVMLTHEAKESSMNRALSQIDKLKFIKNKSVKIRIEK